MAAQGYFLWHELLTWNRESETDFFNNVIGWKTIDWEGGEMPYRMFTKDGSREKTVGGILEMSEPTFSKDIPDHFLGYIGVEDIDKSIERAASLGGVVHHGPMDIPEVGRIAVVQDPQQAWFCMFQPVRDDEPPTPEAGDFSWNELATTDYEAAFDFYSQLFGWENKMDMDIGDGNVYRLFGPKGSPAAIGGIFNKPAEMPGPPAWLFYISVNDIQAAIDRVSVHGGTLLNGPMEVPGGDHVAQCFSPGSTPFALHTTVAPE